MHLQVESPMREHRMVAERPASRVRSSPRFHAHDGSSGLSGGYTMKECPSCGDPCPDRLIACSAACMRIERFRRILAGEGDPFRKEEK